MEEFEKYTRLLREGRTEEATELVKEAKEDGDLGTQSVSEVDRFAENIDGVGEELAEEFVQVFESWNRFEEEADMESLTDVSGVGESRAESILNQLD